MKPRIPWEAAPAWLREDRAEELLRTHRPAPSSEGNWQARLRALEVAKRDLPDGAVREKVAAEMGAMWLDRDRWRQQQDVAYRRYATEDETKALWCDMRAVEVRGMTTVQCGAKKICFLDGKPLPPRRHHWCSDECVEAWTSNHEWTAASHAALRRDNMTCQRCGYRSTYECQGTHLDAKSRILRRPRPWPCSDHPHSGYRRAVVSAAEPGVCGRDGEAWPCGAILRASRTDAPPEGDHVLPQMRRNADFPDIRPGSDYRLTGHWRVARPRGMEVNHKVPREGRGYGQGCHHHLGSGVRRRLANVGGEGHDPVWVVLQEAEREIAGGAQDAADAAGGVIVVYVRIGDGESRTADGARVTLSDEDRAVLRFAQPVVEAKVASTGATAFRAEPGITTSREGHATQRALSGRIAAATAPPPEAPVRAEPAARLVEWHAALKAGDVYLARRAMASQAGVAAQTVPVSALTRAIASLGDAWFPRHAVIVVGTPAAAMPAIGDGLEVLCHPCHVIVTTEQIRARRPAPRRAATPPVGLFEGTT